MKTFIFFSLLVFFSCLVFGNDGVFYARGNQLIPVFETDIRVKREILTISKVNNKFVEVTVYYEFENPRDTKTITVGFEAASPSGDLEAAPKNGRHPFIHDFTVEVNGKILPYQVAIVSDSLYAKSGKIQSIDLKKFKGSKSGNYVDFNYVYHFQATFNKGLNIVKHTYIYSLSSSIEQLYYISYLLTPALRWANKQIDDFMLILNLGDFESIYIQKGFFDRASEWLIQGTGKASEYKKDKVNFYAEEDGVKFFVQKGFLIFQKKNFKPKKELYIFSPRFSESGLPYTFYLDSVPMDDPKNEFEKRVYKNLPFARRGYIFTSKDLQTYFEKQEWYIPNPGYQPNMEFLTEQEKKWVERWK